MNDASGFTFSHEISAQHRVGFCEQSKKCTLYLIKLDSLRRV